MRVKQLILAMALAALGSALGCGRSGDLPLLGLPWNARQELKAAAYADLGWKASGPGTVYLVDASDNERLLGAFAIESEQVFTFSSRLKQARIDERPVKLEQPVNYGHEHELYFVPR